MIVPTVAPVFFFLTISKQRSKKNRWCLNQPRAAWPKTGCQHNRTVSYRARSQSNARVTTLLVQSSMLQPRREPKVLGTTPWSAPWAVIGTRRTYARRHEGKEQTKAMSSAGHPSYRANQDGKCRKESTRTLSEENPPPEIAQNRGP